MSGQKLKVRWAPKAQPEQIRRLYEQDARGIVDDLIDDVGLALYLRCESIVLASTGRVKCPACRMIVEVKAPGEVWKPGVPPERVARREQCGWETTIGEWGASSRHRELHAGWGLPAMQSYYDRYLQATTARERMLLIDKLLHVFHQDLRRDSPHRSVVHNLIEGNHRMALALLDQLAYGEGSAPEVRANYTEWRRAVEQMGRLLH